MLRNPRVTSNNAIKIAISHTITSLTPKSFISLSSVRNSYCLIHAAILAGNDRLVSLAPFLLSFGFGGLSGIGGRHVFIQARGDYPWKQSDRRHNCQ
jgi:hypothetical protein